MLKSKEYNYSHDYILTSSNDLSKVLFDSSGKKNKDVIITYNLDGISSEIINKKLINGEFEIIPLF